MTACHGKQKGIIGKKERRPCPYPAVYYIGTAKVPYCAVCAQAFLKHDYVPREPIFQ